MRLCGSKDESRSKGPGRTCGDCLITVGLARVPLTQQARSRRGWAAQSRGSGLGGFGVERAELEIPGTIELTTATLRSTLKATVTEIDGKRGGKLRIVIDGTAPTTVGVPPRTYKVHAELTTFVRDVVGRGPSPR